MVESVSPDDILSELDRIDSEESLRKYIELGWHILEPKRQFVPGWHIDAICDHLEAVTREDITRLLITVPPGFMKSLTTNVFYPSWEWGPQNRPDIRYVGASYSEALTVRDNRRCRNLIQSRWYQSKWGDRFNLVSDQNAKLRYDTNEMGFKIATSVGGLGTGERGDRFIIDDPHNIKEGESEAKRTEALLWFTEVVPTRVNDPKRSAIIIIMQRVHDQDVAGEALAREFGYCHLMIPMEYEPERACYSLVKPSYMESDLEEVYYSRSDQCWVDKPDDDDDEPLLEKRYLCDPREEDYELAWLSRFDRGVVERDKKILGDYATAGQFQQRPSPRGGGIFQRAWFEIVDSNQVPRIIKSVRGWDLASTEKMNAAYTAGVRMDLGSDNVVYIQDVDRFRGNPGKRDIRMRQNAVRDGHSTTIDIPQDPGQAGKSQKTYLAKHLMGYEVRFSPETGSKELRANAFSSQAEAGNVKLVRGKWNTDYLNEICLFPSGRYADQTDASSRAFSRLVIRGGGRKVATHSEVIKITGAAG